MIVLAILLIFISLNPCSAANSTIDNTTSGGIDGAITAGATNPGDTIFLTPGNYAGSDNVGISINKNVTIQGNGSTNQVFIDAQGSSNIFNIGVGLNVTFINITFINGKITGNGGAVSNIYNDTTMTFINCRFINNTASGSGILPQGGAIYSLGNLNVIGSTFINNTAYTGGAIFTGDNTNTKIVDSVFTNNKGNISLGGGGAVYNNGGTQITGSNFTNNSADVGGAIRNSGNLSVDNSEFSSNNAIAGGAISSQGHGIINAILNITNSNFTANTADGGGAITTQGGNISVTASRFTDNSATDYGGAILNGGTDSSYYGVTFTNNSAFDGGAICTIFGGNTSIVNSNFTNNKANSSLGNGGAIYNDGSIQNIINSTFIANAASSAGAIYNNNTTSKINGSKFDSNNATNIGGAIASEGSSSVAIDNSFFTSNSAGAGGAISDAGSNFTVTNSNFTANNASYFGGAILADSQNASISNSKFTNNKASVNGGGIYNEGNMTVSNNTMNGNTADISGNMIYNVGNMGILKLTYINNSTKSVKEGQQVNLSATLTDDMGNTVTGQNITFVVNGTNIGSITATEGYANISYTVADPVGALTVSGNYAGHNGYGINLLNGTLLIKLDTNSTINVSNSNSSKVGQSVNISGVLRDEKGNPVANAVLNVTVDGNVFTVTTNNTGAWNLAYTPTHGGNIVVVNWAGNDTYFAFTNNTSFNVLKLAVNSTINVPSNVKVGKTITIDGVLVDENGNPVANVPITVSVGGKVYSLKTDNSGRWSLTYKPTHTGTVNTIVNYAGNDKYFSYNNTTTFNVIKGKVIVDVNVVKNSDGSADVIVTVTDEDGDPIPDYKVSVDLDGKHIGDIVTSVLGVGRIHIPSNKLSDGRHVITVTSADENYNANPVSVEFETQNNNNDTNKTNNNPVATATMKNTGMPIIAIILVLLTTIGISIRRKQD
ncbi:putative outer membrane protein pmp12 precursor [Methanobrevibacter cuticularis]|uniref:Putative outer membrane protein pmp12 n=1 Tax=Methanobrevibacter cuticularis TaxID=47311 RepID=A0A166E5I7_9EURY|nr:hypothetical protein [Methanobrevibacter cuticularis]KZX16302.1 putative outer membrane protein pmp12 precursor [Methanobrevibacter cuticularis]